MINSRTDRHLSLREYRLCFVFVDRQLIHKQCKSVDAHLTQYFQTAFRKEVLEIPTQVNLRAVALCKLTVCTASHCFFLSAHLVLLFLGGLFQLAEFGLQLRDYFIFGLHLLLLHPPLCLQQGLLHLHLHTNMESGPANHQVLTS